MKDWKIRQQIYHKLFTHEEMGDDLKRETIVENWKEDDVVRDALAYLTNDSEVLYYPGKSYAVAVTFALLIEREFGDNHRESLKDSELLFGNDPYFVTYLESPSIYDRILERYPKEFLDQPDMASNNFQKTHEYFYLEFLLHEKTSIYAPS